MDPVTAFSLAGTILQFIDSGSKFIGFAWRLYRTGNAKDDLPEVIMLTEHLDQVLKRLGSPSASPAVCLVQSDGASDGLFQLAAECKDVASQLLAILKSLRLNHNPRRRDALRLAFHLMWKEDDIKSLQSRLDAFRSQFNLHLLITLR